MPPRFKAGLKGKAAAAPKAKAPAVPLPQSPLELERVLAALLAPDTEAIKAATVVATAFLKVPGSVLALMQQVEQSSVPESRQMAAVLLRRCIVKHWKTLADGDKERVKLVLLQRLVEEPTRPVRHSIGALISTLAKELVPKQQWKPLLPSLLELCGHPSEGHREVAMMLFCALAENLTTTLKTHFGQLQQIFTGGLSDPSVRVRVEALRALSALVDMLDEDSPHSAAFSAVIEPLLSVMNAHFGEDDVLGAGFEVLDNLAQSPTQVLDPFIPRIAELMARIVGNSQQEIGTREKAAQLLEDLCKHKVHRLMRPNNLLPAILELAYSLVCEPFEEDDTDVTPQLFGSIILDALLLNIHVPKRDVFPVMLAKSGELVQNGNPDMRKGGFVLLAMMAEGCGQLLVDRLSSLVPVACGALTSGADAATVKVRMAACQAIIQFADHLHPDISQYHQTILPALMHVLVNPQEHNMVKGYCCTALDVFCQHLDSDIGQYMHVLMPQLLQFIHSPLRHVSRSAIFAIKAVAQASKDLFEPYLEGCMTAVGAFLLRTDDESLKQRCSATECIGAMGAAVGKARFTKPLSDQPGQNYYDIAFHMVMKSFEIDDFELRESSFAFFSDMAEMAEEDFASRLPMVMPLLLATLFTDDGVDLNDRAGGFNQSSAHDGLIQSSSEEEDDGRRPDRREEDISDSDSDDEADDERKERFVIRSGALDEKISALHAITTIAPLLRTADFAPYVKAEHSKDVFNALYELSEYPHPYIRAACVQAIRELLLWFHRFKPPSHKWAAGEVVPLDGEVQIEVMEFTKLLLERMDEEDDLACAAEACDGLGEVLQAFGVVILQQVLEVGPKREDKVDAPGHLLFLLNRFLQEKAPSQIPEDMGSDDGEGGEGGEGANEIADHDFVLMESVSDLIAILAQVMGPAFEPGFRQMFPLMERFMREDKQAPTKGMAIGCFAEVLHWLTVSGQSAEQHVLLPYLPKILSFCKSSLADPSPLVRRNAAFCAGSIARVPTGLVLAEYPTLLRLLAGCYQSPSGPVDAASGVINGSLRDEEFLAARDNACSAIGKLISTRPEALGQPMSALIDLLLTPLPLQVDFAEARHVYGTVMQLYRTHSADVTPHTARVVGIFCQVFGNPDIDTELQREIIAFCKALTQQAPAEMERIFGTLTKQQQEQFTRFVLNPPAAA